MTTTISSTDEQPARCYRDRDTDTHYTRNTHTTTCTNPDCRGCRPCPADNHCNARRNCTWHLPPTELVCGECLHTTRRNLRWVGNLAALMLPAALDAGINSEAANLAGPVADPEAWSWRKAAARAGADHGRAWHISLIEDDDEHHPALVTGRWAHMLAEAYGHPTPPSTGTSWAVAYLDRTLHRLAHDPDQDFPTFAREIRKCRQHLEAVLHNDDRPDRGAPCPECTNDETGVGPRLVREWGHWCDRDDCTRIHHDTTDGDWWVCPRNRDEHRWTHEDYTRWIEDRRRYVRNAARQATA